MAGPGGGGQGAGCAGALAVFSKPRRDARRGKVALARLRRCREMFLLSPSRCHLLFNRGDECMRDGDASGAVGAVILGVVDDG